MLSGRIHEIVLHLPILTTILASVFATLLFSRYRRKGGGLHLLWWGIGMVTYAVGTMTESLTTLFGWNPAVFKLWYISGAFLGGYPLAQGSIYLLMSRRFANWSASIVTAVIVMASVLVLLSPLNAAAAETHRLSGRVLDWQWLRAISPFLNLYSVTFLVGGAVISAVRFRREPAQANRYAGNIFIAVGAILPGIGGAMTRFGMVEALYITELVGLLLIFSGYRLCLRGSQASPAFRPAAAAVAILLALISLPALAQEEQLPAVPPAPSPFFAETTVTATGSERDVFNVATPVTVINEEEIQRQEPDNAADLLRQHPGVDVNGVGPNQQRPIIRGQRGLRVLFLENGLRLNNPRRQTDFGEIAGLVNLESVSTIEVVRGPASVLYGSDAVGGVLNVISRNPSFAPGEHFTGFTDLRYSGAGDQTTGSLAVNGATGRFTFQLGGTVRNADDYEAPAGRFGDIRLEHDVTVIDTGVEDRSLWGSVGFNATERDHFRLRFSGYRADQAGFGLIEPAEFAAVEDFRIRILYPEQAFDRLALSYFGSPLDAFWADSTNVQLYYQSNERELVNDIDINIGPVAPGFPNSSVEADSLNVTDLDTWGLRADAIKALGAQGRHIVTYGVEGYRDDSFNTDFSLTRTTIRTPRGNSVSESTDAIANAPNATNSSFGVFAQDEIAVTGKLRVTAGLRYHDVQTRAESTPNWNIDGLDFSDDNVVGALTAAYQITSYMNLFGSAGTAFRSPNIIERLFNGATPEGAGFQILNPELSSENSENLDLGIKYRRWNAFLEAVVFRNDISDGIVQYFLSPAEVEALPEATRAAIAASRAQFVVQQRNVERLRYDGLELALGWRSDAGVILGGNFTHIESDRIDSDNPPTGDSYSEKIFAYARYQPGSGRYWAEYHVRHNDDAEVNLDPDEPAPLVGRVLPAFTVHGVGGGARVLERAGLKHDLTLWVENLSDELYSEFSNATFFRPEPGRTLKISYRLGF